jgi:hypothetical protein
VETRQNQSRRLLFKSIILPHITKQCDQHTYTSKTIWDGAQQSIWFMLCPFCKGVLNLVHSRWPACHAHGHKIIMLTQAGWSHAWSQEPEPTHHRASLAHGEAKQMIAYYTTVEQEHELTLQLLSIIITFHHLSRITLLPF